MENNQEIEEEQKKEQEQTITPEEQPTEPQQEEATAQEEPKEPTIEEQLAEAQLKIAELQDKYLRQVAEFDNYRKRTIKEKAELILNGGEKTIVSILPILDDMERALGGMDKMNDVAAVKEGVDLIFQKFMKTLGEQGVKRIETEMADFNTDLHEAIAQVPAPNDEMKGKVIDCVKTGYMLNDKVIRHAQVAVGL